jgi:protein tyrosine phosphatase (PTP) superfamily phosphohydrolase (DUF442 family)
MSKLSVVLLLLFPLLNAELAGAAEETPLTLLNEVRYSPNLTTAGQPQEEELRAIADAGFQRVIFLAFSDHENAVKNEDRIVRSLGMEFFHVPIMWSAPTISDFDNFAALMLTSEKTLVHCEVNFRASVFGFLYQVIYLGMALDDARSLLTSIWIPNTTWEGYITAVLHNKGIDYERDWGST